MNNNYGRRRKKGKQSLQLRLTMFSDKSPAGSSEDGGVEPNKVANAIVLSLPPYLDNSRQARLTEMDSLLNELRVEIHRLPTPSRYIARLILDAFLEVRDTLEQEGD